MTMTNIETFIKELHSENACIRRASVEALGDTGRSEAIAPLVDILKEKDVALRDSVVQSLLLIGGKGVAEAVVPLLYDEDAAVRNMVIEILEKLGPDGAGAVVTLLDESDEDVLKFAIDIIGTFGESSLAQHLTPFLAHKNPNIRAAAAVTLGRLGAIDAADRIVPLIKEENEWVRFSALEALGQINCPELVERLIAATDGNDVCAAAALDTLSHLAPLESGEVILPIICDSAISGLLSLDTTARFIERFAAIMDMNHKGALLKLLVCRLEEGDLSEQRRALRGIALLKDERSIELLLAYARQINEDDF
ncbi:MAG: HEAT repeat domain-containing protein, partial [Deltaproteobacteria bacterium]|nr:HEAT repeat domain-containing protein [Deltaproteobacteria bacterium]